MDANRLKTGKYAERSEAGPSKLLKFIGFPVMPNRRKTKSFKPMANCSKDTIVLGNRQMPRETLVNGFKSGASTRLMLKLLRGFLVMMKRILFLTLTAFVITLPITGIWSLSLHSNAALEQQHGDFRDNQAPKAAYLERVNNYFESLRSLIDDQESFGPFT